MSSKLKEKAKTKGKTKTKKENKKESKVENKQEAKKETKQETKKETKQEAKTETKQETKKESPTPPEIRILPPSETASGIINKHMYWSVATGMIPIPIIDVAAVTAIQLDMLKQLSRHYDSDYSEVQGKSWIGSLTTNTMSSLLVRAGVSAIKTIPVVGTAIGVTSMAILSGASTYAIGHVFVRHFEAGGTMVNFDTDKYKIYYVQKMNEGKLYAKNFTKKFKREVKKDEKKSTSIRLEELAKMHKAGLITDEEQLELRKNILSDFTAGI